MCGFRTDFYHGGGGVHLCQPTLLGSFNHSSFNSLVSGSVLIFLPFSFGGSEPDPFGISANLLRNALTSGWLMSIWRSSEIFLLFLASNSARLVKNGSIWFGMETTNMTSHTSFHSYTISPFNAIFCMLEIYACIKGHLEPPHLKSSPLFTFSTKSLGQDTPSVHLFFYNNWVKIHHHENKVG